MKKIAIIPARMGSSRFPGKPIYPILGRPMLEHIYRRVSFASSVSDVIVATCDQEIKKVVEGFGGKVVMTSASHERASDRIAEAAAPLDADCVVMVQGDEPMVTPAMIDAALAPFDTDPTLQCVNLTKRITDYNEWISPNTIKVVMDTKGNALYMSRSPIPHAKPDTFNKVPAFKQVCIIPFRKESLALYTRLSPTPLEIAESVDMMRFVENGISVKMIETQFESFAVDHPADVALVENHLRTDPLTRKYL